MESKNITLRVNSELYDKYRENRSIITKELYNKNIRRK